VSNVRIILESGGDKWEKFAPIAMWHAKKARADGHTHGYMRTIVLDGLSLRVVLDDFGGDKVFISPQPCWAIKYNGFVDTFRAWDTYPMGISQRAMEYQEDIENLPRMRNGVWIEGDPMMYGVRMFEPHDYVKDPTPLTPPGMPATGIHPLIGIRQSFEQSELFRKYFYAYRPTRFTGLMRRVLQCTFATDSWSGVLLDKYGNFLVNYTWGDSWGVVLAPGKDGSSGDHYFLIWITLGEVHWVPASFCVTTKKINNKEVFAPIITKIERTKAKSLGKISYDGTSQFDTVGWAFSYTKPEASVVLFHDRGTLSAPEIYTGVATITINFGNDVPVSVSIKEEKKSRMWHGYGYGSAGVAHTFERDISGEICLSSVFNMFRGGPVPIDKNTNSPFGVFYKPNGDKCVLSFGYFSVDAEVRNYPYALGNTVWGINGWDVSYKNIVYFPVANNADGLLNNGYGTVTYDAYNGTFASCSTGGGTYRTKQTTATVTDSRTKFENYANVEQPGYITFNYSIDFIRTGAPQPYSGYEYYMAIVIFVSTNGSETRRDAQIFTGCSMVRDDPESFVIASTGVTDYFVSSRSASWYTARTYPAQGKRETIIDTNYPQNVFYPGLTYDSSNWGYFSPNSPPAPASGGLFIGTNLFWGGNTNQASISTILPPGSSLPDPATTRNGNHFEELLIIASGGTLRVTNDPTMVSNMVWFHDPKQENDSYWPVFYQSAFRSEDNDNYIIRNETTNKYIVRMGGGEYNIERFVNGFIGVV